MEPGDHLHATAVLPPVFLTGRKCWELQTKLESFQHETKMVDNGCCSTILKENWGRKYFDYLQQSKLRNVVRHIYQRLSKLPVKKITTL